MSNEWKPIETAPKDRRILVASGRGRIEISQWVTRSRGAGGFAAGFDMYGAILWTTLGEDALVYWAPLPELPDIKKAPAGEDRGQGGQETTTKNEPSV